MPSRARRRGTRAFSRASFSALAAIYLLLSTSLAAGVAHQLHQMSIGVIDKRVTPKYLVVLVLDGARPDYLSTGSLPNLQTLVAGGTDYTNAWAGILESETPAGHATLSTGSTPAHDGLLGFNWITDTQSTVHLFDPDTVRQGGIEHVMEAAGASTIASLFKARYPRARVVAVSGHKYYAADPLGGPNADYIMYYAPGPNNTYAPTAIPGHVPPQSILTAKGLTATSTILPLGTEDTLATKLAMESFRQTHQQVTLINLPEFDWPLGHVYGGEATRTQTLMQGFDQNLGYIEDTYRKAGVLDQTVFVVTADHGMSSLQYQIPDSRLADAVTEAGTTAPEITYSTGGFIWLQDASLAQIVAQNVVKMNDPHIQSVYYKVPSKTGDTWVRSGGAVQISSAADGANQYLLSTFAGGNAPDVVAFCTENAAFVKDGAESWKGNHGGGSWGSQHIPLIIAGPGIARSAVSAAPARLEDVAPTVLSLFGIKALNMQGSVLADALERPTPDQTKTEQALDQTLDPVVTALSGQSQHELAGYPKQQ